METELSVWSTKDSAVSEVCNRLESGQWTVETDQFGIVWIHSNPDSIDDRDSVYGNSLEHAVALAATCRGQAVGFEWAFPSGN